MRKLISILLCVVCVLSLVGCAKSPEIADPPHLQMPETILSGDVAEESTAPTETKPSKGESDRKSPLEIDEEGLPVVTLETVDVSSVLKAAYENTFNLPLTHITATRLWHGAPETMDSGTQIDTSNHSYDVWLYNETGEVAWSETRTYDGLTGSTTNMYVLRVNNPEKESCDYKVYRGGYDFGEGEYKEHPVRCLAGYESVLTPHWPMLLAFEDAYNLTMTAEEDYYVVTSKPLVSKQLFPWDDGVCIVTMYIRAKTLTFSTITVSGPQWTESASFKFFADDCDKRFYNSDVRKALEVEPSEVALYDSREDWAEKDDLAKIVDYEHVMKVYSEENINECWSVDA